MTSPADLRRRAARRCSATVTVLDVRYRMGGPAGRAEYERGHVPGRSYVDLDTDLAAPPGRRAAGTRCRRRRTSRRRCAAPACATTGRWSSTTTGRGSPPAARWWLLRHHGHPDVRVLDGAWAGLARGRGSRADRRRVLPGRGDFTARPGAMPVVEADEVLDVPVLVDARAPERYRGETEPVDPVAGHIPGAVNVPTDDQPGAPTAGSARPTSCARCTPRPGSTGDEDVAVYCGSGVTAAHDVLALEVAGIRGGALPGQLVGLDHRPGAAGRAG